MLYQSKIEKSDISTLPPCDITGEIIVIDRPEDVAAAIEDLKQCPLIGFDTETRPSFRRGESNTISLLQLATEKRAYLFRLKKIGQNQLLKDLLESNDYLKVGLSVHDDFHSLNRWMPCRPNNFIELQRYVKAFGIEEMSLQKIYAIVFHKRISKRQQLSNWEAEELTPAQQQYAAIDAWACRNIYYELQRKIKVATI
ncbi:MAG: 3'-5' exonuclease domain-containing protein 2 [Paludibacteraceae bacterium]|nr:3'-5' exonuclease domain-containing protein 2 [Paludibacteraceae bacterium]MBO5345732.1 3'-5' exonuclease domain-containing protein 2 [Paludibacteraceae bacterium]